MSYDNPNRTTYWLGGSVDFGGSDEQYVIKGPKGKAGKLVDYGVQGATEVFNGSTVTPKMAVGTASDPDAYGEEFDLDDVALNSGKSVLSENDTQAGIDAVIVNQNIAADTLVYVTVTAATGSPTGIASMFVTIDWEW